MRQIKKIKVTNGVYWLEIPEADLYILCGCPADSVKHLMKIGLIVQTEKDGATFETGPNCILLSDALLQNRQFSNLSEFPVLQMLYRQGMILPNHPNNKGIKPLLIGKESQIKAQKEYIYRGNYGLASMDELRSAGLSQEESREQMRIKLKFAFGKIRETEELLDSMVVGDKFAEIRGGVFIRRSEQNRYSFKYKDEIVDIDLNLKRGERYDSPYDLGFHQIKRGYFSVIHSGEGDGWDFNRPCMASILNFQGKIYLIDAGPNILNSLLSLGIDPSEIEGIFHTHAHDDHFAGLPVLLTGDRRYKYFSTPLVRSSVTKKLCALMSIEDRFDQYFDVHDLKADVWNKIGALEVKPILSPHPIETNIFIFRTFWENKYYYYGHWADVASFEVLNQIFDDDSESGALRKSRDRIIEQYLTPVNLKKIDVGGGMIHGMAEDFKDDASEKIILSHMAEPLDARRRTLGSSAGFGMIDVLIPSDRDYLKKRARSFLEQYFPNTPGSQIETLLNCPVVSFNPGSVILKKGKPAPYLYLILTGTVEYIHLEEEIGHIISTGVMMGELSITNNNSLPGVYRAVSCVEALKISAEMFDFFVKSNGFNENINLREKYRCILQDSYLFGDGLSWAVRDRIARTLDIKTYAAGETILGLNETEKKLFLIQEGKAEIIFQGKTVEVLEPGMAFGEELFIHAESRRLSASALTDVKVAFVTDADALEIPIVNWRLLLLHDRRRNKILSCPFPGLHPILEWLKKHGDTGIFNRLNIRALPFMSEYIAFDKVTPNTKVPYEIIEKVRKIAEELVDRPCPY